MIPSNLISKAMKALLLLAGISIALHPVWAQQGDNRITVQGIVIDASNGQSVENTLVTIPSMDIETRTDQIGQFSFQDINIVNGPPNKITFNVEHKAYKKFVKTVDLNTKERIMLQLERKPRLQ